MQATLHGWRKMLQHGTDISNKKRKVCTLLGKEKYLIGNVSAKKWSESEHCRPRSTQRCVTNIFYVLYIGQAWINHLPHQFVVLQLIALALRGSHVLWKTCSWMYFIRLCYANTLVSNCKEIEPARGCIQGSRLQLSKRECAIRYKHKSETDLNSGCPGAIVQTPGVDQFVVFPLCLLDAGFLSTNHTKPESILKCTVSFRSKFTLLLPLESQ